MTDWISLKSFYQRLSQSAKRSMLLIAAPLYVVTILPVLFVYLENRVSIEATKAFVSTVLIAGATLTVLAPLVLALPTIIRLITSLLNSKNRM